MHKRVIAERRANAIQKLADRHKLDMASLTKDRYDSEHSQLFLLEALVEAQEREDAARAEKEPSLENFLDELSKVDGIGEVRMHTIRKHFGVE